jgi:glycosyltransferase involved in cell wall biosynthesis
VTIHDVLFLDFPDLFPYGYRIRNKILFSRSARRADYLLTVSEYSRKAISEHLNVKKEKIHIIPNGIADEFFELKKSLPDVKGQYMLDKYILYVSRIEPRKNHFLLLKAFTELNLWKEGYKLVCIGKEYIRSTLFFNYLDSLPEEIRKFVTIIERSQGDELISFYRNCRLFVYPSLAEGFGIPPLEAVASNVPVLCADTTAMSEYRFLGDRQFDPRSLDELKEKILKSLNSGQRDFRSEIEFVKVKYSWRNSAAQFKDLILKDKNCDS